MRFCRGNWIHVDPSLPDRAEKRKGDDERPSSGERIRRAREIDPWPGFLRGRAREDRYTTHRVPRVAPAELLPRHADEGTIEISRVRAVVCMYALRDKIGAPRAGSSFEEEAEEVSSLSSKQERYILFSRFSGTLLSPRPLNLWLYDGKLFNLFCQVFFTSARLRCMTYEFIHYVLIDTW